MYKCTKAGVQKIIYEWYVLHVHVLTISGEGGGIHEYKKQLYFLDISPVEPYLKYIAVLSGIIRKLASAIASLF